MAQTNTFSFISLCISNKLYLIFFVVMFGMVLYIYIFFLVKRKFVEKRKKTKTNELQQGGLQNKATVKHLRGQNIKNIPWKGIKTENIQIKNNIIMQSFLSYTISQTIRFSRIPRNILVNFCKSISDLKEGISGIPSRRVLRVPSATLIESVDHKILPQLRSEARKTAQLTAFDSASKVELYLVRTEAKKRRFLLQSLTTKARLASSLLNAASMLIFHQPSTGPGGRWPDIHNFRRGIFQFNRGHKELLNQNIEMRHILCEVTRASKHFSISTIPCKMSQSQNKKQ